MSREKQIEEMARDIFEPKVAIDSIDLAFAAIHGADKPDSHFMRIAQHLYNAGYRKQEWISVDERLPKQWEMVLVFCDDIVSIDFISSMGRWYEHIDHDSVTHWTPLPEAPKMKGGAE